MGEEKMYDKYDEQGLSNIHMQGNLT